MQRVLVPWQVIAGPLDAEAFSRRLLAAGTFTLSRTSISSALTYGMRSFDDNGFTGHRRVIDISGDGPNNAGAPVVPARDLALASGIIINGLPLMTRDSQDTRWSIEELDRYYTACVTGGPGSFVIGVLTWADFADAVRRKLALELIGGMPPDEGPIPVQADAPVDCLIGEKTWMRQRGFSVP